MTTRKLTAALLAATAIVVLALWGDPFVLQLAGYLPILIGGWVVGSDSVPAPGEIISQWALWQSVIVVLGVVGLFWLARRAWPARHLLGSLDRVQLRRVLRWAVVIAFVSPLVYAVTRIAWVLGIPLGLSREFLDEIQPIVNNGLVLGLLAVGGAVLTVGLLKPWGEAWPRWMPVLGGRAVPVGFARNFALTVSFLIAAASAYFARATISGQEISIAPAGAEDHWGAWLPELLWPAWALGLAVAAFAYAERRRRGLSAAG